MQRSHCDCEDCCLPGCDAVYPSGNWAPIFQLWRWGQHNRPKCRQSYNSRHGV